MAEVDFGDSELFQQFDEDKPVSTHIRFTDNEEGPDGIRELRERLEECEETIDRLNAENQELKRKLNILSRPSGINVENANTEGPLFQILFGNNNLSKRCRQEIEDGIFGLIQKHQEQRDIEKEGFHVNPQSSSFVMEENYKTKASTTIKKIKEAFSMVGSVLYFTSFCLDKLGQPLLNDNPQLTDGWEVPKYQQVFAQVIALDGTETPVKERRPKPCCFNCDGEGHQLRDCPQPKDMARINEKRKAFSQGNNHQSNQRYHVDEVEERFSKYKPGIVSEELLDALGLSVNTIPPFIYRMRELGYPPGWLKEAEMENSGLTLYDGKTPSDGEVTEDENGHNQNISFDVSKLVDFPGFNASPPSSMKDEYRAYGSIPMQPHHMKQNFAAYLSNNYPTPGSNCNKRRLESESTPRQTKKRRSNPDAARSSDMDMDSDQDAPRRPWGSDGFQFQPPLPPGSPSFGTPPPLPLGTPPVTPTPPPLPKGTPPPTPPTNGSPAPQGRGSAGTGGEESEDGLTLEELEEQQRLIWAALETADTATNSDSETVATGTPVPSSPGVSTPVRPDAELEDGEEEGAEEKTEETLSRNGEEPNQVASPDDKQVADVHEDPSNVESTSKDQVRDVEDKNGVALSSDGPIIVLLDDDDEKDVPVKSEEGDLTPQTPVQSVSQSANPEATEEEEPAAGKVMAVPHRSKFAEGIIPFEDTPEFTEVAEATGTYLRIRDLLKGSPRNQAKIKK